MITIIHGAIDSGKTTTMYKIFQESGQGDGFIAKKIYREPDGFIGYEIMRLSSGEKLPLAFKSGYTPENWDEIFRIGPFHFSRQAFQWGETIGAEILAQQVNPVFIDEIGPLELEGKGWATLFNQFLNSFLHPGKIFDIYITVRQNCLESVPRAFQLPGYRLIVPAPAPHTPGTWKTGISS